LDDPATLTVSETTDRSNHHQRPGEKQQYRDGCRVHVEPRWLDRRLCYSTDPSTHGL